VTDSQRALVVLVAAPSEAKAVELGRQLVDEHLAACATVVPGVTSIYQWEGRREQATEALLVIKTRADGYEALERRVLALHPYSVPEVLALGVDAGAPAYLQWVHDSVLVEGR
jgi:periplasmic divalent cation tolerance protein